jgi:hypothetical protein
MLQNVEPFLDVDGENAPIRPWLFGWGRHTVMYAA